MSATGTPQGKAIRKQYTSASSADTTTFAAPPNMADWCQIIGAGSTVLVDESGTSVTITTDAAEPAAMIPGPWIAFTSTTATRVRMGNGDAPPVVLPVTGLASGSAITDTGNFTAQTEVNGSLQELYQHLFSATGGCVPIPLSAFREVNATGDVPNIAGIGGVLASDTAPILLGKATTNDWAIQWATGNVDPIGCSFMVPSDFDDTADATLTLIVSSGSTNAATMAVASSWNGGSEVTDSASDAGTLSATEHAITATIAAADIPADANRVTFRITPPTHGTDAINLTGARLNYKRKLLTS